LPAAAAAVPEKEWHWSNNRPHVWTTGLREKDAYALRTRH